MRAIDVVDLFTSFCCFVIAFDIGLAGRESDAAFPRGLRGTWYSWERGRNRERLITERRFDDFGSPVWSAQLRYDRHEFLFAPRSRCHVCAVFVVHSWNILERFDSPCVSFNVSSDKFDVFNDIGCAYFHRGLESVASETLRNDSTALPSERGVFMYRETTSLINCRHSIYGNYRFAYQVTDSFTGECEHHDSRLESCDAVGSQFFISSQKFLLRFRSCAGIKNSFTSLGEYVCLGEWREGLQQYFVAANVRESRKEERYRCFLKNREDPYYLGMSRSPSCRMLRTPENSPIRLRLTPLKLTVSSSCLFPSNLTGRWASSGQGEPAVTINETHIVESRWLGHQLRSDVSVCVQNKGKRFLVARVSEFGCQTEYVCWEILPRHHNIVRFRKSRALSRGTFEVCDFGNFGNSQHWKYDTLINEVAVPVSCPFSGRFSFGQSGSVPLRRRVPNGITRSPLDTYRCLNRETELAVCGSERKHIVIDLDYCLTLNRDGRPVEINTIYDYHLSCVGYWKENLFSYLITHDPFDSVSKFRCWVYQRVSLTEVRLSRGLGSACGLRQKFTSASLEDGASLALNLTLKERLYDQCPMYYNDGSYPWDGYSGTLKVFSFNSSPRVSREGFVSFSLVCFSELFSRRWWNR